MRFFVGTSGYSYPEWKGRFYPENLSPKKMLSYYAQKFAMVEVNYTFRALPSEKVVMSWIQETPEWFRFVLKAHKAITHDRRLKDVQEQTDRLIHAASALKDRLGPILYQFPPGFQKDVARLRAFFELVDGRAVSAFEFRH